MRPHAWPANRFQQCDHNVHAALSLILRAVPETMSLTEILRPKDERNLPEGTQLVRSERSQDLNPFALTPELTLLPQRHCPPVETGARHSSLCARAKFGG